MSVTRRPCNARRQTVSFTLRRARQNVELVCDEVFSGLDLPDKHSGVPRCYPPLA